MKNLESGYEERLRKRMQLVLLGWCTPCASKCNWGWLKFSVVHTQNFTLEYIIASGYFADFFSGCCVISRCSRLEVFNKVMRASWTRNFLWSLKYLAFKKWRQVVHHWWTGGAHHVCVSRENWDQLEFPRVLLSELSSYINYINLSNFFSLDYTYWETLFIICFP